MGEFGKAIDDLEHLADRGFVHPDASYDRGVAYVMRVRGGAERPGDLGRAAAGFEEALLLRPHDARKASTWCAPRSPPPLATTTIRDCVHADRALVHLAD